MNETAHEHGSRNLHPREADGAVDHSHAPPASTSGVAVASLKDPVCGMTVTDQSPYFMEHAGAPVYFCSAGCKAKFAAPCKWIAASYCTGL